MRISLLGSTGSIGRNTLQVLREMEGPVSVAALAAGRNLDELLAQVREFRPVLISVADEAARSNLLRMLSAIDGYRPEILCGPAGNLAAATQVDYDVLVSAAVGVAGLEATFEAVRQGKRVALANKEVLVVAGELVMAEAARSGAEILPVDSEHNAAHQCLRAGRRDEVERLILTASGGPFRTTPASELANVTPEQALNHPTWKMGNRITIDSATLMNKGFEVIEACHLFDFRANEVDVVVHPQSVIHALVEYRDGSVIAQMCPPDMKLPIQYALSYPDRDPSPRQRIDWKSMRQLDFEPPDRQKFPLLELAYESLRRGGASGCLLNAADEVAVEAFLGGRIPFLAIAEIVEETLSNGSARASSSVSDLLEIDREARVFAETQVARRPVTVGASLT
jgi:1-deoxy-D-xylulose-5-phosphate reductoisomerase